uniref:Uncharacterized protein n=1 Tax=Mycena chlorophos TaxID=658473 RepID=A0ABQ0LXP7_MYCCL|nr:predicted protein [Mycena chlorophos]
MTPGLKYALTIASGDAAGERGQQEQFFADLLTVMTSKDRKAAAGKGMQGFQWKASPLLLNVAQTVFMISPAAYRAINHYLPLPNERTLQHRAQLPKFPVEFTRRTITLAKDHMTAMGWAGPVAMSCDDTKLQAALRPFYDEDRESWCILGSTGSPILVANIDEFRRAVESGSVEKATKLRLWCLQVCCPGVPSYVLAAKGISDSLSVPELFAFSWKMLTELIDEGVCVCSYANDGTTTERNVQHMIADHAQSKFTHSVHDPHPGYEDMVITVAVINGQPVALIQDDLHLKKTLRNNPFSGAKSLTFPRHTVHYAQVLRIAQEDGPIYRRDVVKLDRQDDNAAARLFNADTLEWLVARSDLLDDNLALVVYLFVFGELIDAYQNRTIATTERVRMVLRAHFFVGYWEKFLAVAGYSKAKHFLSPECADIIKIFVNGFFQLLFIHRDHLPEKFAMFLYLVGTSLCEHAFGCARKFDPDFTLYTFYQLKPKITLMLHNAILTSDSKDAKARAGGYNFSYLDRHGVDAAAAFILPTDSEIASESCGAYEDVTSLFWLLGVDVLELNTNTSTTPGFASIPHWAGHVQPGPSAPTTDEPANSDAESDCGDLESGNESEDSAEPDLQHLVAQTEGLDVDTKAAREHLMRLRYAAVSLEVAKDQKLCVSRFSDTESS